MKSSFSIIKCNFALKIFQGMFVNKILESRTILPKYSNFFQILQLPSIFCNSLQLIRNCCLHCCWQSCYSMRCYQRHFHFRDHIHLHSPGRQYCYPRIFAIHAMTDIYWAEHTCLYNRCIPNGLCKCKLVNRKMGMHVVHLRY